MLRWKKLKISIHAPTRGATTVKFGYAPVYKFQSTLPREERHGGRWDLSAYIRFQSTLPREERPEHLLHQTLFSYFNPRSHERSDMRCSSSVGSSGMISIHAPTRGATVLDVTKEKLFAISIHAPTRGATQSFERPLSSFVFQSTLPREERRCYRRQARPQRNFNPRSHERSDVQLVSGFHFHFYFNPRSHERSDQFLVWLVFLFVISIHAPTRGATVLFPCPSTRQQYFTPRSHERSDGGRSSQELYEEISIHAPTRGATFTFLLRVLIPKFQSTLPREERQFSHYHGDYFMLISIHAPTRGATEKREKRAKDILFQSTLPREERLVGRYHRD